MNRRNKTNESEKVTLTLKQLKRLVSENSGIDFKRANTLIDCIETELPKLRLKLQDLYRDSRYGNEDVHKKSVILGYTGNLKDIIDELESIIQQN